MRLFQSVDRFPYFVPLESNCENRPACWWDSHKAVSKVYWNPGIAHANVPGVLVQAGDSARSLLKVETIRPKIVSRINVG